MNHIKKLAVYFMSSCMLAATLSGFPNGWRTNKVKMEDGVVTVLHFFTPITAYPDSHLSSQAHIRLHCLLLHLIS